MLDVLLSTIWNSIVSLILSLLPGFLLRLFITPERVKNDFEVDLRSDTPAVINFGATIPSLTAYLRCTNKSAVPILVDRILLEAWIGQPIVEGAILTRVEVRGKQTCENLSFRSQLSTAQQEVIKNLIRQTGRFDILVHLNMDVYCDCKVGRFELLKVGRNARAVVEGLPAAKQN